MRNSMIIIGGGIAGLSAGIYAQFSGYKATIFEQHTKPGGCCTAWERQGYTVDSCIHWLVSTKPGNDFYKLWDEVGAIQDRTIVNHDIYASFEDLNGKKLMLYSDIERLTTHFIELAPEDEELIRKIGKAMHKLGKMPMPVDKAPEVMNLGDIAKMMIGMIPFMPAFGAWKDVTITEFSRRIKNPFLRRMFSEAMLNVFGSNPELPMLPILMTFGMLHEKMAGYPVGGSMPFTEAIEKTFLDAGGTIHYEKPVEKILHEKGRAYGVRLRDGTEHRADIVISAADGYATLFEMLDGKFVDENLQSYYDDLPTIMPIMQISLGINDPMHDFPQSVAGYTFETNRSLAIGGRDINWLTVLAYTFDPTLAPIGKTFVKVIIESDWDYWNDLHDDPHTYNAVKKQAAKDVLEQLERKFPGLSKKVEMTDVATPLTFERFTGNHHGAYMGWRVTPKTLGMMMRKTLPGLKDFFMTGQWVEPGGGLPTALKSGRNVVQLICKQDRRPFKNRR